MPWSPFCFQQIVWMHGWHWHGLWTSMDMHRSFRYNDHEWRTLHVPMQPPFIVCHLLRINNVKCDQITKLLETPSKCTSIRLEMFHFGADTRFAIRILEAMGEQMDKSVFASCFSVPLLARRVSPSTMSTSSCPSSSSTTSTSSSTPPGTGGGGSTPPGTSDGGGIDPGSGSSRSPSSCARS